MALIKRTANADADPAEKSPLARRPWQFTLRRLAIGIAIVCGLLAVWSKYGEPYRKERQVLSHLASLPVSVRQQPYGPSWLQQALRTRAPMHVTSIEGRMSDDDLRPLRFLPTLYDLELRYDEPAITDIGLKQIGTLTSLHRLTITSPKITDDGVNHLAGLKNLRHLELPHQISDAAMVHLYGLTNLETLICAAHTPPQQVVLAALEEMTEADFTDQPLVDVMEYFQARHDIAIDSRELVRAKRRLDVPITCKLQQVSLFAVLRQILEPLGLDQTLGPNRLLLTTREAIEADRPQLTKLRRELPRLTMTVVDWDVPSLGPAPTSDEEQAIESLAQLARIDVDQFGSVSAIRLSGSTTPVGDDVLQEVAKLKQLQELDLAGTRITDHGLSLLTGLDRLVTLDLNGSSVSDDGITAVASFRALRDLHMNNTAVSDKGVAALAKLRKLARLSLAHTSVTGKGLVSLKNLLHLEWLWLDGVSDDDLAALDGFSHLRALQLAGPRIGNAGMTSVAHLLTLESLHLANTSVTSDGIRDLSALPALAQLTWTGVKQGGDFAPLSSLRHLKQLVITGPAVCDESLATLPELSQLEFLSLDGDAITDAGLDRLPSLVALRSINLFRTQVTPNGITKLQRRYPRLGVLNAQGNRLEPIEK